MPEQPIDPLSSLVDARLARRAFVFAVGAFLAGCASDRQVAGLPEAEFPGGRYDDLPSPKVIRPPTKTPIAQVEAKPAAWTGGVVPRARWAKAGPDMSEINPMLPVKSITVHHEGWEPFTTGAFEETADRIERVRVGHRNAKGGGYSDIGYHFIVDREGRIWEGRSLRYQGAHVKHHNEGNVGIMCLGNFEVQSPTQKQLAALAAQVKAMRSRYNVPLAKVYTHREWDGAQTLCPGRGLQGWVDRNRRRAFA